MLALRLDLLISILLLKLFVDKLLPGYLLHFLQPPVFFFFSLKYVYHKKFIFSLDGSKRFYEKKTGKADNFSQIGLEVGQILKTKSNNSYKK